MCRETACRHMQMYLLEDSQKAMEVIWRPLCNCWHWGSGQKRFSAVQLGRLAQDVHRGFWQLLQRGPQDRDREGPMSRHAMQWWEVSVNWVFYLSAVQEIKKISYCTDLYRHVKWTSFLQVDNARNTCMKRIQSEHMKIEWHEHMKKQLTLNIHLYTICIHTRIHVGSRYIDVYVCVL